MTDVEFIRFVRGLREEMRRHSQDEDALDVDESAQKARLPLFATSWFTVHRSHLEGLGGTPEQIAAAVYAVYRSDLVGQDG